MPIALRYGVPYEIFWTLNPKRLKPWQVDFAYREQERMDREDYTAWLNGMYVLAAVGAAFDGKKCPYPSEPYSVTQYKEETGEAQRKATQQAIEEFKAFAEAFNKQHGLK